MAGIDLGLLPPLSAVRQMTQDEIQKEMATIGRLDGVLPSDPAGRVMLAGSYRESLLRQDADEQVRAVMLATAHGGDLDHIGVTYYRDVEGKPVLRLEGESDEAYRLRLHDSPSGLSTAGPKGAYEFHTRSAHPNIKQALCISPAPVKIRMYVLGYEGSGTVSAKQLEMVDAYLWNRRPLTDQVEVVSAEIVEYSVKATIKQVRNSDPESVLDNAKASCQAFLDLQHRLKGKITLSALYATLMVRGVDEVVAEGWADVVAGNHQAPYCVSLEVIDGGWAEEADINE